MSPTNYHARLTVAADGSFAFSTVRPVSYTVPDDGPAGDMLRALGREAWRPAHLHMIIQAPGHKPLITEFFPEDDKYLDRDAVFGVRAGLVLPFRRSPIARACRPISRRATACRCRCGPPRSTSRCRRPDAAGRAFAASPRSSPTATLALPTSRSTSRAANS